jgi:hypothetical protein
MQIILYLKLCVSIFKISSIYHLASLRYHSVLINLSSGYRSSLSSYCSTTLLLFHHFLAIIPPLSSYCSTTLLLFHHFLAIVPPLSSYCSPLLANIPPLSSYCSPLSFIFFVYRHENEKMKAMLNVR